MYLDQWFPRAIGTLTKQSLMSEITSIFNVMGWCSYTIIKTKIILRDLWKEKTEWDQPVSQAIYNIWQRWREELFLLQEHLIPQNYSPKKHICHVSWITRVYTLAWYSWELWTLEIVFTWAWSLQRPKSLHLNTSVYPGWNYTVQWLWQNYYDIANGYSTSLMNPLSCGQIAPLFSAGYKVIQVDLSPS